MNVLVVGSSLFDAIISLVDNPHVKIADNIASFSLGDKIPIDIKAFSVGGNGANVASALHKLGIQNEFYTYIGQDPLSEFITSKLASEGITIYEDRITTTEGPLSLIFNFPEDRTIFSHHPQFEHSFDESKVIQKPDVIFLTSIGKIWEGAYEKILEYAGRENIAIAFSPGSLQMKEINETFIKTVHQSKMLFCNMDEAKKIHEKLSGNSVNDVKELLLDLKNYGFELLSITDGGNGSYAVDQNNTVYKIPTMKPDGHEKTGAGDAYAGAFLAAHLDGKDISTCMKYGVLNSLGVMSKVGAHNGQLTHEQMEEKNNQIELVAEII